jgi:hypothetical protein
MVESDRSPTLPSGPNAIVVLATEVNGMRAELAAGIASMSAQNRSVLDALARLEANYKILAYEHANTRRELVSVLDRVAALESAALSKSMRKGKRRAKAR